MKSSVLTTRKLRNFKRDLQGFGLHMLTCYDFQSAQLLNETEVDMILVGDSLGNVILGYPTTVNVTLEEMAVFGSAVVRGAPDKFVVVDMPFGSYASKHSAIENAITLYKKTSAQALKLEGASDEGLKIIKKLTDHGVAVMGHIGLTPQAVHQMGGYYVHGKDPEGAKLLKHQAQKLQQAGCFAIVLECVEKSVAKEITDHLSIPTIGIGSGDEVDGQVLVLNDLLGMGKEAPPSFCRPRAQLYQFKKEVLGEYLKDR